MSSYIPEKNKATTFKRACGCCEYCQSISAFSSSPFSIEHIIPKVKGGSNDLDNLALSCQGCNNFKYTKTEIFDDISQQNVSLFHPRLQEWREHFKWSEDFVTIIGITPTGRVTIKTLKLNREENINLRTVLFLFGHHPPIHTL